MKLKIRQFLDFVIWHSNLVKIYLIYIFLIVSFQIFFKFVFTENIYFSTSSFIQILINWSLEWDGLRYYHIYLQGYQFPNFAFFPGYVLLLYLFSYLSPFTFISIKINLILILFLIFSIYFYLNLIKIEESYHLKTILLFLFYPFSIFLSLGYSETVYLIISIWVLYFLNKNVLISSLLGFFLGLFKITAVILPLIYFVSYLKSGFLNWSLKFQNFKNWIYFLIVSLISISGVLSYFLYLQIYYGSLFIFFDSQAWWGRLNSDFSYIHYLINTKPEFLFARTFEILSIFFLIYLFIFYYKKVKMEHYLFSFLHAIIPLATGTTVSINRFTLFCFPILLVFFSDIAKDNKKFKYVLIFFVIFYIFNTILLANQIFIG